VPLDYSAAEAWPVIVDLHGNSKQGSDALLPTQYALVNAIRMHREAYPVIGVFPQAPKGQFWEQPLMQQLVMAELDQVVKESRIDSSREYLTGYSMGAAGTYRLAYKYADRFAAFVTGAGTIQPIPERLGAERAAIDTRTNSFTAAPDAFDQLAGRIKAVPIWIFHGDSDTVVAIDQSRQLVAALTKVGATVKFTEMLETVHNVGAEKMWATPGLIEWLLSQHRSTNPSHR
jgi:predicted peptidase